MRLIRLAFLLLAACGSPAAKPVWPASACRQQLFEQSRFTVCDAGRGGLRLIAAARDEPPLRSFTDVIRRIPADKIAFAMNAGMFDEDGRPIGLAVVAGRPVHAINLRNGGGNFT